MTYNVLLICKPEKKKKQPEILAESDVGILYI